MTGRAVGVIAFLLGLIAVGGVVCIAVLSPPAPVVATAFASHVKAEVSVVGDGDRRIVEARFEPDLDGLHLYGPDLPVTGIDGAGRPTRLAVIGSGWRAIEGGPVDVAPTPFATSLLGFSSPFSIQPDGPVTLRQPIERLPGGTATVRVALSWMACTGDGRCFPPVDGYELDVPVR